ncbi:hypothetical protein KEJ26_07170 [Candidatus Bathyarchaeota archaeon]|nr:hypothetical protein [Candidatus Bathyarchaeota archaeon]
MASSEWYYPFTWIGLIMIALGVLFILIPFIVKYAPAIEKLPPILVYVYRHNNFYFATSPILIIVSILSILAFLFSRYLR